MTTVVSPAGPVTTTVTGPGDVDTTVVGGRPADGAVVVGHTTTPDPGNGASDPDCCPYAHQQVVPSSTWVINHGRPTVPPAVSVLLDAPYGDPHRPAVTDVDHFPGQTILYLPLPATGWAYL